MLYTFLEVLAQRQIAVQAERGGNWLLMGFAKEDETDSCTDYGPTDSTTWQSDVAVSSSSRKKGRKLFGADPSDTLEKCGSR
jgi:hypothetical protein